MSFLLKLQKSLKKLQSPQQEPSLTPDSSVLVAVSGGRDSVALLHGLLACGWPNLVICHVNHGLRGTASGQDAVFVRRMAARLGLPFEGTKVDVARLAEREKISVELAARQVREAFFLEVALRREVGHVFLAHHADDQAETILGNLCRGTALRGMRGMALAAGTGRGSMIKVRPLLAVNRAEIDVYIEENQLRYREDASNAQPLFRRNRLRHEVLPLLNEVFRRDVAAIVVRAGAQAARDDAYLQQLAAEFAESDGSLVSDGGLKITARLKDLHQALLSRVIDNWLRHIGEAQGVGTVELEAAMEMILYSGSDAPAKVNLSGDRWLRRKAKRLFVERSA